MIAGRLGVDFGTSNTVAMLRSGDGAAAPLLFDSSPLLASGVFVSAEAEVLTGVDAARAATAHPAGFEANPKRRIDDGAVWLGDHEVPVAALVAAVLRRIADEAHRVAGSMPGSAVLTHPATWSRSRLGLLSAAARDAGYLDVRFVAEPVAAAAYFTAVLGHELPQGHCLVVYDLGAGTFDVSVVRHTADHPEVVATDGLADVGGLDLDAAVVRHARSLMSGSPVGWGRLDWPETPADQRAHHALWQGARAVKEQLSRHAKADLHVPLVDADVHVTREEFERAARPYLDRTVALTLATLRSVDVRREQIAGVFLVGGSSRIPLVASLLHRAMRIAPTVIDQPELVVAIGSLYCEPSVEPTVCAVPDSPAAAPVVLPSSAPIPEPVVTAPQPSPSVPPGPAPGNRTPRPADGSAPTIRRARPIPAGRRAKVRTACAAALVLTIITAGAWYINASTGATSAGNRPSPTPGSPDPHAIATLTGHTMAVASVVFSPGGRTLASAGADSTVRLWNVATRQPTATFDHACYSTFSAAFSPDGTTLVTGGGSDNTARLWNVATGQPTAALKGHTESIKDVAFSPDGKTVASSSVDATVRLWNAATGQPVATLTGATKFLVGVAFSPDGKTVASAGGDTTVRLWNVATGQPVTAFTGHTEIATNVAFSPDGKTLASAAQDNTVRLWNLATGRPAATLNNTSRPIAFSPDGTTLAAIADDDTTVRLWNVATGQPAITLPGHTNIVYAVAFSPDGKILASAGADKTVRLWSVITGQPITTLTGHTDVVDDVAFSPDGKILASAGSDKTVRLWDVAT